MQKKPIRVYQKYSHGNHGRLWFYPTAEFRADFSRLFGDRTAFTENNLAVLVKWGLTVEVVDEDGKVVGRMP